MSKDYYDLTEAGRRNRMRGVAEVALQHYPFDVVRIRGLADATNGIFRLDTPDGTRYAMRVSIGPPIGHSVEETRSEMEWLHAIAEGSDVVVPEPVATADGEFVVVASAPNVPHERTCSVVSWLEGPLLADGLNGPSMRSYGAAMAKLHAHAATFKPSPTFTADTFDTVYPYDAPFELFDVDHDLLPPGRRALFQRAYERVAEAIRRLQDVEAPRITHADMHMWNVKVNRGKVAVFDFEDMLWGWPVQDIATALYYLWTQPDFDDQCAWFRSGYETISPWPDAGGDVETFIAGRTLVMANDVVIQPEFAHSAPEIFERGERRIADMFERIGQ